MRDWDAYRSCFTDEVDIDFTSWGGGEPQTRRGDDWAAGVRAGLSGFQATQHISTNHVITLDGDEATCVSYMQAQALPPQRRGRQHPHVGRLLHQHPRAHRRRWRIRRCQLTVTWTTGNKHIFVLARERFLAMEAGEA